MAIAKTEVADLVRVILLGGGVKLFRLELDDVAIQIQSRDREAFAMAQGPLDPPAAPHAPPADPDALMAPTLAEPEKKPPEDAVELALRLAAERTQETPPQSE